MRPDPLSTLLPLVGAAVLWLCLCRPLPAPRPRRRGWYAAMVAAAGSDGTTLTPTR